MATPITLPQCAQELLDRLYPTVDWSRVIFLSGLPWWTTSGTAAITLPDPIDAWRFRVYLGDDTDFCDPNTLTTLVHEAMHVAQFMAAGGGIGLGFYRPGFIAYFACHFAHGYDNNPFEVQADEQDKKFRHCYGANRVCDCSGGEPTFDPAALEGLVACDETLVKREVRTPFCPTLWWFLALPLVLIIAILGFIGHIFDQVHCHLLRQQFDKCIAWGTLKRAQCNAWATQAFQQCSVWEDQGYAACSQWVDEGYSTCSEWADEGYSTCSQWADQGYNACCTWWPCSWGCKALVWISNMVCVATIWVTNMVCKATVWISNMVCKATVWISALVCKVWVWVSRLVCVLWTWILEIICLVWTVVIAFVLLCWI